MDSMATRAGITVAIDAGLDIIAGSGVERAIVALVASLDRLDGDDRYLVVTSPLAPRWIAAYTGHRAEAVVAPRSLADPRSLRQLRANARARSMLGPLAPTLRRFLRSAARASAPTAVRTDRFLASLGADVVHFPFQRYVRTGLPAVYEPWDLQHRHLPHFFTGAEFASREATYLAGCAEARAVVVASDWVYRDLIQQFGIPPSKVYRIRRPAPVTFADPPSEDLCRSLRERFHLPESFLFYPAHTWPHKNHLRLIEALALLRPRSDVSVVCSGTRTEHFRRIRQRAEELGLGSSFISVGHISDTEIRALYRMARGLILPSLFEGYSLPIVEAFAEDLAVAASSVTCLPEIVDGAALLFDPTSVVEIAAAMDRLWADSALRVRLVEAGRERLTHFDPMVAARTYRALYRSVADRALSSEDEALLAAAQPDDRT